MALRAFCDSLYAHVNADRKLIPLWLEFGIAIGANKNGIHQNKISYNSNDGNRYDNDVPFHVYRFSKPVYLAGGEGDGAYKYC